MIETEALPCGSPENSGKVTSLWGKVRSLVDLHTTFLAVFLMLPNLRWDDPRVSFGGVNPVWALGAVIVLTVVLALHQTYKENGAGGGKALPLLGLFFALSIFPAFLTDRDEYGVEKIARLFTLTALSALLPVLIIRNRRDFLRLASALTVAGGVYGLTALGSYLSGGGQYRIQAMGSNPITVGRAVGASAVCLFLGVLAGRLRSWWALPLSIGSLLLVVGSGSRGPLLALLISSFIVFAGYYRRLLGRRAMLVTGLLGASVAAAMVHWADSLPLVATGRLLQFFEGNFGESELARVEAFEQSLSLMLTHPLGIGWGNFDTWVNLWKNGEKLHYPHNIFVEIFLEGGWLAGGAFLYICWRSLRGALRTAAVSDAGRLLLAMTLFYLLSAMVSGDINTNRILMAFLSMGLCAGRLQRR